MKLVSGTISLCFSFVLFIYLSGLKMDYSSKYSGEFFLLPVILLLLTFIFFGLELKSKNKKE